MPEAFITSNAQELVELLRVKEAQMAAILKDEAKRIEVDLKRGFNATVATWNHKPAFQALTDVSSDGSFSVLVGTDDKIYSYVNYGPSPHVIRPKVAKALRFQSGYRAKTVPNVIGSGNGGPYGNTVFSQMVHHPGTRARNFVRAIFDKEQGNFFRRIANRVRELWQ